jgi:flagellar basal-body rod modification protein FlgD
MTTATGVTQGPTGNLADYNKPTTTDPETVSAATNSTSSDKDMFLKLLLAQMKYQDPMNPTDSTQYLSQMAQFTTVEKLGDMVDNTNSMLATNRMQSALGMIGATVEYGVGKDASSGIVTGITVIDGTPQLVVDSKTKVPLTDLTSVKVPGRTIPKDPDPATK